MSIFAAAVFFSAFLLFAIQPMVAKFLLPAFGGSASVWATCLVVFQVLLLGGYGYAHFLRTCLAPKSQRWVHLLLLAVSLLFLPPAPAVVSSSADVGGPVFALLRSLLTSIALPFLALSATAPMLMEWFRQSTPGRSPDRLYAYSNAGSLLALLCYPLVVEPTLSRAVQARGWAVAMLAFVFLCAVVAWRSSKQAPVGAANPQDAEVTTPASDLRRATRTKPSAQQPGATNLTSLSTWLWVALPACGSALLLALTNQISQDVAPLPLLWVAPMSVYLLTFILCFEGSRSYRRGFFIPAVFGALLGLAWLLYEGYLHGFWVQVGGYLGVLFLGCMFCHGELYRLRPPAQRLTAYYLGISFGGALGGAFVGLVAPAIFKTLLETPLIAAAIGGLAVFILWREQPKWSFALAPAIVAGIGLVCVLAGLGTVVLDQRKESIYFARSFYGAYRVKEGKTLLLDRVDYPLTPGTARVLLSGQIYHGLQFTDSQAAKSPTTYYSEEGGLGLAFRALPVTTNRNIGAIGLGTGTLAAYGRPGDRIRFYELNPDVLQIAESRFTFLTNSAAKVEVVLGDGRLSLAREPGHGFDLLVLDAFSGDSIPMHLLTDEAMGIYQKHLSPLGVMAFHISNSHLDLEPVVRALAERCHLTAALVPARFLDPREGKLGSIWMLVSANQDFFNRPGVGELTTSLPAGKQSRLWTDDYSSILPILH